MSRSRFACALALLGLLLAPLVVAPGAGAVPDPNPYLPLSAACANVHQTSDHVYGSTGTVAIASASYAAGEQLSFLATSDQDVQVVVDVRGAQDAGYRYGTPGTPIQVPIPFTAYRDFRLLSNTPGAFVSWKVDCGVPPVVGARLSSRTLARGQVARAYVTCVERSYPLARCAVDGVDQAGPCTYDECSVPLDTATLGDHSLTFTATDVDGLRSTSTSTYTVVRPTQTITAQVDLQPGSTSNYLRTFAVSATATSGLPVSVAVAPASSDICSYTSTGAGTGTLQGVLPGDCVLRFDQGGDDAFEAAPPVTRTVVLTKDPQSIYDIVLVPAIGSNSNYQQLYFVYAKSTSGLPVVVTVDPSSADVCGSAPSTSDPTWVGGTAPGTCVVRFNQPGDATHTAAVQQTRTFELTQDDSKIIADPAIKGVLGLTPTRFAAKLFHPYRFPIPLFEETVVFSVGGKVICRGTVARADGYARCSGAVGFANAFSQKTYTASYAGNRYYSGSTAVGVLKP